MEYYSAIKKNEIKPLVATWTRLQIIVPSEGGQTEEDRHRMMPLACGIQTQHKSTYLRNRNEVTRRTSR